MALNTTLSNFYEILADLRTKLSKEISDEELMRIAAQLTQADALKEVAKAISNYNL